VGGGGGGGRPAYPNLEVSDDNDQLRVVDASGAPVDCRVGDTLYVPVMEGGGMMYVLASGNAEDLTALLRQGRRNRLPMVEINLSAPGSAGGGGANGVVLKLTNMRPGEKSGKVRVIDPTSKEVLGERTLELATNEATEMELAKTDGAVVVEVETERGVQRTAMVLE